MWKGAIVSQFEVLSQHLPGDTKENHVQVLLPQSFLVDRLSYYVVIT
jgi:hypothetical protein